MLIASGLFHLGLLIVTGGSWQGPVSWHKPMTFGLSFGLTLGGVVAAFQLGLGGWVQAHAQRRQRHDRLPCDRE